MKPFKSIEEQIDLLKDRGLLFKNEDFAKDYLLTNNYYDVINGYSKFFQKREHPDNYIDDTYFDEISRVHFLDREIKYCFFKHIILAENHFKSILAHRFSETYSNIPYAYLKTSSFEQDDLIKVSNLVSKLSRIIIRKKRDKKTNPIKHYANNHNDVPIWVLIDYITFGEISYFYDCLDPVLKNKIAVDLTTFLNDNVHSTSFFSSDIVSSFLSNIIEIRNVSAHNNRLLGYKCKKNTVYFPPIHDEHMHSNRTQRQDVFNVFLCLQAFLSRNQYAQLHNTLRKRFNHLDNNLYTISINEILNSLGFPNGWHKTCGIIEQSQ